MATIVFCTTIFAHDSVYAANEDLRPDISEDEYLQILMARESDLKQSEEDVEAARTALNHTLALLVDAEAQFQDAIAFFSKVEMNPLESGPEYLDEAWQAVATAWARLQQLTETLNHQQAELLEAEQAMSVNRVWLEKHKNDYEAQSDPFAARDAIARCASETCSASDFLTGERIAGLGQRLASQGVEVASLDSLGAPFWSSPARFMSVRAWNSPLLIPSFSDPAEHGA